MRSPVRPAVALALLAVGLFVGVATRHSSAQAPNNQPNPIKDTSPNQKLHAPAPAPASNPVDEQRRAEIKAIDEKIKGLREQMKSEVDPLDAQIKAVRARYDAEIKPLQDQREQLIEEGESPELKALNEDEKTQLAAVDTHEKEEMAKVRQQYDEQRKEIRATFSEKRHELMAKK
jgi:hypothetical protein